MKSYAVPLLAVLAGLPAGAALAVSSPALEEGFRIASAIQNDAKDRGRAQESVVLDLAEAGFPDEAARKADQVEGWRRGVAYAEIARILARQDRLEEARALLAKADAVRAATEGWEGSRIEAHAGQARALVGQMDRTESTALRLVEEDQLQYAGLPAIVKASAQAARGEIDPALATLGDGEKVALEMVWWRTSVFLEIARSPKATPEQRRKALEAGRTDAARLEEVITRLDALERVATAAAEAGMEDLALAVIESTHPLVAGMPDTAVLKGAYLAGEARTLARLGRAPAARERLASALASSAGIGILDRPAILANIAGGYQALTDSAETSRVLGLALAEAEALANARPRALAAVEICRAAARFGIPWSEGTARRVASLRSGLKAPW